jgi:hypothetical protein
VFTTANTLVQKPIQRVLQDDLQTLLFDLDGMHIPTPNSGEVMEFAKGLRVKERLEKFPSLDK